MPSAERVEGNWCTAITWVGALCNTQARATHHAVQVLHNCCSYSDMFLLRCRLWSLLTMFLLLTGAQRITSRTRDFQCRLNKPMAWCMSSSSICRHDGKHTYTTSCLSISETNGHRCCAAANVLCGGGHPQFQECSLFVLCCIMNDQLCCN